ncbi:hypothetical protein [Aurantiacibacter sediminis]|uniref:Lipoprotein n=1 Tax=Aurantiacibacter sediminis TaxID=2793064 RepID=A0ABS0N2H0_9SPHN|nr:hypothetical protein [Aurantiacibacter sediminis]MBH5322161.1 hypothetical protein [Aurantiacibacter sediminis]
MSAALICALALSACNAPEPEPTPLPPSTPVAAETPAPVAAPPAAQPQESVPVVEAWQDERQTPGDWSYVAEPLETLAVFGTGRTPDTVDLIIRCDLATRRVGIARSGAASGQVDMLIRTETQDRTLTATPVNDVAQLITVELSPNDSLLDAIAFSKGRFAVDVSGTQPIYVPAYPEITRVMEDCRG